jgi:Flp pilus assembly protein TadG
MPHPRPLIRSRHREEGQTLVEFALVLPLFLILLIGTIEFAFMFNATLNVNFASRNASLTAAESGMNTTADCAVLAQIEQDVGLPVDKAFTATSGIQSVTIFKANRAGAQVSPGAQNVYIRTGTMTCAGFSPNPMPYTLVGSQGYPMGEAPGPPGGRCALLTGCSLTIPMDSIGVSIRYRYPFHTPVRNLVNFLPGAGGGYLDFTWSNVMRMEPIL